MSSNMSINRTQKSSYENSILDENFMDNVNESIEEYINNSDDEINTVLIGQKFCEWVLYNLFELREDEVINASDIGGQFDNGIDALFKLNDELYVLQCKYNSSHSIDSMDRFMCDCKRLLTEEPLTNRNIVEEKCELLRESFKNKKNIKCYYVTNSQFQSLELNQIKKTEKLDNNVSIYYFDINRIIEKIREIQGLLPIEYRDKKINLPTLKHCEMDDNTTVASVSLKDFRTFVYKGNNMLFLSNIRNYLNKTKINKKMEKTLDGDIEKFWYYNNGITIVSKNYNISGHVVEIVEPQIVNGCQTAKSILNYKSTDNLNNGKILIKIIRIVKKDNKEEEIKKLKDNITRYTNSQNAVKGLDFYALDEFQRELKIKFEKYGYYYEIQRGSYLSVKKSNRQKYKGCKEYNYLLPKKFNNVLPAKEVIQTFTAGIKQLPNIAYNNSNELTPIGDKWDDICNDETKLLPMEHFIFPYLLLKYIKYNLEYKQGAGDFRGSARLVFISAYYKLVIEIMKKIDNIKYDRPEDINIDIYKSIFGNSKLNLKLINSTDRILYNYFTDSKIDDDYIHNDIKNFLKVSIAKDEPKYILEKKIKDFINQKDSKDLINSVKEIGNKVI